MLTDASSPAVEAPPSVALLTTKNGQQWLLYRGPREVVCLLLGFPHATVFELGRAVALPLTRDAVMVLEVLGQVETAPPEYAAAVQALLAPSARAAACYPPPVPGAYTPRPHQTTAFGWQMDALIAGRTGVLNASCLGSGKTRMAIDLMRQLVTRCALVVGVKTTLEQWKEELAREWPAAEAHVLHQVKGGTVPNRVGLLTQIRRTQTDRPQVVLVNWETLAELAKPLAKFGKFDLLVADEASKLLGRTTAMARAAKHLAWKHAYHRLALTGTPVRRSVEDLLALFQFVDTSVFGSRIADFRTEFCDEVVTGIGKVGSVPKPAKVAELVRRVYSAGFRVSRAAVDLPEPARRTVRLAPSAEQTEALKRVRAEEAENVLTRLLREQQITAGFQLGKNPDWESSCDTVVTTGRPLDDPKLDWIERYLTDTLPTEDCKVIVWTKFIPEINRVYDILSLRFPDVVARIDGSVPDRERQTIRRRFNDRQDPLRILVMNLQTGALGLDLPAADVMLYHGNTFNYVDRYQSEGRGTRLGRTTPCQLVDLVLEGTADEYVLEVLAKKQATSDLVVGQGFLRYFNKQ